MITSYIHFLLFLCWNEKCHFETIVQIYEKCTDDNQDESVGLAEISWNKSTQVGETYPWLHHRTQ